LTRKELLVNATQAVPLVRPAATSLFDRKPFYRLMAAVGFVLISLAGLLMLAVGVMSGDLAGAAPIALIFLVPGPLGLFLAWKVGKWGLIPAVLLAVALLVMNAPFLPFALAHPEGGVEFIVVALFVAGAVLAIAGSGVSLAQWLRRSASAGATPGQRLALTGYLGLTAAVIVASIALTALARTSLAADVRAGTKPLTIKHFAYAESPLWVAPGDTVRLAVRNDDTALHTFTLEEAGIDVSIPPGAERLVEFTAPASGTYTWYCVPHSGPGEAGREGMVGTLIVGD
jgi:plastocyanin